MNFFSKLKDYHNLLETILDQKTFSSMAKSLCLSMVYKLEIAYKDYIRVKVDCVSKDVFLDSILNIIKNYCDHIKIVEPESSQAALLVKNKVNALTNSKERSILLYPTEVAMLEAIADIEPKYFFVKKEFEPRQVLQNLLVNGYKQNMVEILKNFNGWSWDIDSHEKMDFVANIVYQNIMMIKNEQFLYDWRMDHEGKKNYLSLLKRSIKSVTENDEYYEILCNLLKMIEDKEDENKVQEELIDLQKCFLKFLEKKIEKVEEKEEITKIIAQLRLFQNLNFGEGKLIKDCKKIDSAFVYTQKMAITKACKLGAMKIVSMDIETNFQIYHYILDTRIIDLEQIKIELNLEEESLLLKVYDKEVFEKQGKITWNGKKKDIAIRKKKQVNIFN